MGIEVELQIIDNLACFLGQSIFAYQRHDRQLDRSELRREFQYDACLAVFELFFLVRVAEHAQRHAVDTDTGLNVIRRVAFVGFRIEILDLTTGVGLVLGQIKVCTTMNAFDFFETEGHLELDVGSCIGVMSQFFVIVEAIVLRTKA